MTPAKPVRKKLIEVALPLETINAASAREKSIRHGHPSNLHRWWARRPFVSARAVIFAQMVDDPSSWPELFPTEKAQDKERQRLFRIIGDLVQWENTTNETVLNAARVEIWASWRRACAENADHPRAKELFDRDTLPGFHDPFAGGGALPLEAQRLGLESNASDLNPVAVLINKAMIEIPPKFAGRPPVNPEARKSKELLSREWKGAEGLAEDVRYYGQWMRDEAEKRIGHLYPKVAVTAEMAKARPDLKPYVGKELTVIAWLWARTVKSPNPAFANVDVPLTSSFMLCTKAGKEAYVEPVIENDTYRFTVKIGKPSNAEQVRSGTKLTRANFMCLMSDAPISGDYIKSEGKAGRMSVRLMALVAQGERGRVYLAPTPEHEAVALNSDAGWKPDVAISGSTQYLGVKPYGMERFDQLFTGRQLKALATFSDLVHEAQEKVRHDALAAGCSNRGDALREGGNGAKAYAEAVGVYLSLVVSKTADSNNVSCPWEPVAQCTRQLFGRQAISMLWDYGEANPLHDSSGGLTTNIVGHTKAFESLVAAGTGGFSEQADATTQTLSQSRVVSTDPPYYDNVPYADLSDFFYLWVRRSLQPTFPELFATVAVPKAEELVAFAYRHDNKKRAEMFFLEGMTEAVRRLAEQIHPAFPLSIFYAFRQAETESDTGTASTGWETFLAAVLDAGFAISGTWPMRTEMIAAMKSFKNSLASSIILACRRRAPDAPSATRREFLSALKAELPEALANLQAGNIAPVDLAQAAIGPGMAVYSRYSTVLDAEGRPLSVREALALINQTLDEALAEQEGDFDADSRWALTWFEQNGFDEGEYGVAEQLSKSKNTSVNGMEEAGILESRRGKVRLFKAEELSPDWDPDTDPRLTAWEVVHHLVRVLASGGESAAALLVAKLGARAETARELCYRLYTICERKKRAADAMAYNGLVQAFPEISRLAAEGPQAAPARQKTMLDQDEE
jgi:putative DNA methylase